MEQKTQGRLTVSGEGRVQARPDVANINLGVMTEGKTASDALADNAQRMTKVLASIQALGIPATDLQTVGLSMSPVMDWEEGSPTRGQVVAYRVEDTLSVRADVKLAGKVLDEGVAAGANVAGSLSFGLRDDSSYRDRAMAAAVESAKHQAAVVARAADVTTRGIVNIDVSWGGTPVIVTAALTRKAEGTPVEPGTLTISSSVRVEFAI